MARRFQERDIAGLVSRDWALKRWVTVNDEVVDLHQAFEKALGLPRSRREDIEIGVAKSDAASREGRAIVHPFGRVNR